MTAHLHNVSLRPVTAQAVHVQCRQAGSDQLVANVASGKNPLPARAGSIHQAEALPGGGHSLHVTISACQRTTWADFLAVALPRALDLAADASIELRQSLPRDAFGRLVRPARLRGLHAYVCR